MVLTEKCHECGAVKNKNWVSCFVCGKTSTEPKKPFASPGNVVKSVESKPPDQRPRLIASFSSTEGYKDFSNDNVRVALPVLKSENTVFYSDCKFCKDRHANGQKCPEKSLIWMNLEGNRVVSEISKSLDVWALSPRKEAILEALNRFDGAWDKRDEKAFSEVVSEINAMLDVILPDSKTE